MLINPVKGAVLQYDPLVHAVQSTGICQEAARPFKNALQVRRCVYSKFAKYIAMTKMVLRSAFFSLFMGDTHTHDARPDTMGPPSRRAVDVCLGASYLKVTRAHSI